MNTINEAMKNLQENKIIKEELDDNGNVKMVTEEGKKALDYIVQSGKTVREKEEAVRNAVRDYNQTHYELFYNGPEHDFDKMEDWERNFILDCYKGWRDGKIEFGIKN